MSVSVSPMSGIIDNRYRPAMPDFAKVPASAHSLLHDMPNAGISINPVHSISPQTQDQVHFKSDIRRRNGLAHKQCHSAFSAPRKRNPNEAAQLLPSFRTNELIRASNRVRCEQYGDCECLSRSGAYLVPIKGRDYCMCTS